METSLSNYYPKGTRYFYGYPAGEASNFYNAVPPWIEELVAARPLVCAGKDVQVVSFAQAIRKNIWNLLSELGTEYVSKDQVISLPENITEEITGAQRNGMIAEALKEFQSRGKLVMAQPFSDSKLDDEYQLPAELVIWLNDKINMPEYIPSRYLPQTYKAYENGRAFLSDSEDYSPCVVKVASSSSGDGVLVCKDRNTLRRARIDFQNVNGVILVQEYIDARTNIGVQFAVPYEKDKEIEVLGSATQITNEPGEFMGGFIPSKAISASMQKVLTKEILLNVRERGWYGIGGFDVLEKSEDEFYFIDPNFRMTALSAFLYQKLNGITRKNMAGFTGTFDGTEAEIRKLGTSGSPNQLLNVIAMTKKGSQFRINATMLFDQPEALQENARELIANGIRSSTIDLISQRSLSKTNDF